MERLQAASGTNDIGLPISALATSASLHDSQAAIPLIKLTSRKVTYLYDLMDASYGGKNRTGQPGIRSCRDHREKWPGQGSCFHGASPDRTLQNQIERGTGKQSIERRLRRKQRHGQRTRQGITSFDVWGHYPVCRSTAPFGWVGFTDQGA